MVAIDRFFSFQERENQSLIAKIASLQEEVLYHLLSEEFVRLVLELPHS